MSIWISARIKKKQDAEFGFDDEPPPPSPPKPDPEPDRPPAGDTPNEETGKEENSSPYGAEMTGEGVYDEAEAERETGMEKEIETEEEKKQEEEKEETEEKKKPPEDHDNE